MSEIKSNMGLAKVEYPRIVFHHPFYFLLWGGLTLLVLATAFMTSRYWIVLLAVPFIVALAIYTVRIKGLFFDCDVNLGKVLSRDKNLYAVIINLNGAGEAERLVIKIAKGKVPAATRVRFKEDEYFPVICYPNYNKKPDEPDRVFTLPLSIGVSKLEVFKGLQDFFASQIEDFEKALSLVPMPKKPGLYKIDNEALAAL